MKKFQFVNINDGQYELIDIEGKRYKQNMEFCALEQPIKINDYIFISERLLDRNYEGYAHCYYFGDLNDMCGRTIPNMVDELIVLYTENNAILLKRLYG